MNFISVFLAHKLETVINRKKKDPKKKMLTSAVIFKKI